MNDSESEGQRIFNHDLSGHIFVQLKDYHLYFTFQRLVITRTLFESGSLHCIRVFDLKND